MEQSRAHGSATVLGVAHTAPAFEVPKGACDCHVHVFGPVEQFPFSDSRVYTPGPAPLEDLLALQEALHLARVVIVGASPYGADNSCLMDSLRRLGPRGRGVAVIDESTTAEELRVLHSVGIRGARVNLETVGQGSPEVARSLLQQASDRVAHLGWHVQVFTNLSVVRALKRFIENLPVTVVIDHFGRAQAALGPDQPGFSDLTDLLRSGKVYVKISAPYRISQEDDYADAARIAKALIAANEDRVLWGTDWPHPDASRRGKVDPETSIEPYHKIDDGRALNQLSEWASTAQLQKILVDNPRRLYEF